jgi:L-glutamine-phosphate cytidylyltransferase
MKAVILSAGQGKRLLPLTADTPKCLVSIDGRSLIEWQINELAKCGIERVTVVVGYHAGRIEQLLHRRYDSHKIQTLFNPTYSWADNLFSCWAARTEMTEDFVLLNGDTLFEAAVLNRLLETPDRPVTVATHKKSHYDADDMKVTLDGDRLIHIGKNLSIDNVDGESIGMILFRGEGPARFCHGVESALGDSLARKKWYLSVIDELAQLMPVWTYPVKGLQWCEVDFPVDLKHAQRVVRACAAGGETLAFPKTRFAWG